MKISRKTLPTALKHLTKNKTEETTKKDIADTLWEIFSANSCLNNSNLNIFTFKSNTEAKTQLQVQKYSKIQLFTPAELQETIETSYNMAVGPDEIHYDFLKHLPKNSLDYLLTIYNKIWINNRFPES